MVRLMGRDAMPDVLIDPFNRGRILSETECRALLLEMYGGQVPFSPDLLKRARTREILRRLTNNLKWIYQQRRDYHMALRTQQLLLCIDPDRPEEIRDRGLIQFRLALIAESVADLERYLALAPRAPDAPQIEKRLLEMVARGDALAPILDALCGLVEELLSGSLVSILLVSADGKSLRHGAAPSLPRRYTEAIDTRTTSDCCSTSHRSPSASGRLSAFPRSKAAPC